MEIKYIDRKTSRLEIEKVYGAKSLSVLYGDGFFNRLFSLFLLPLLAHLPFFSQVYGFLQKRKGSAKKVDPFIETYGIDKSEFVETKFQSFNDFFTRKLKPEKRPLVLDPKVLVMPADARYFVYPEFKHFVVKGKGFSLSSFLNSASLANRYKEGSLVIARLCPTDYHRFHFPCDGFASHAELINGPLYSVNPLALKRRFAIAENKRMITEIETDLFGTFLYIEIGATSVGSIKQTYTPDAQVKKGQEKGYFEFGGSCLVLLFEKNRVKFDSDLIENTKKGFETRANFGESLGSQM